MKIIKTKHSLNIAQFRLVRYLATSTKKIVKMLMEFFLKIKTKNTINYDVTFGVILSTEHCRQKFVKTMCDKRSTNVTGNYFCK